MFENMLRIEKSYLRHENIIISLQKSHLKYRKSRIKYENKVKKKKKVTLNEPPFQLHYCLLSFLCLICFV